MPSISVSMVPLPGTTFRVPDPRSVVFDGNGIAAMLRSLNETSLNENDSAPAAYEPDNCPPEDVSPMKSISGLPDIKLNNRGSARNESSLIVNPSALPVALGGRLNCGFSMEIPLSLTPRFHLT